MFTIRTYNHISPLGLQSLPEHTFSISEQYETPDALLLRSHTLTESDCTANLLAIARAGAGTNNVPIEHCSKQGIVVFNTPGANANAVKELVITALLLGCRGIAEGMHYVQQLDREENDADFAQQVEANKKAFKGVELKGKTLGVVGLGAIGASVASSGLDLGMNVIGFDPAISVDAAWRLPSSVTRMESLESLLQHADFITLHVPALPQTIGLLNAATLAKVKPGAVVVNFARGEIVDNHALLDAIEQGVISKYIHDFPAPELQQRDKVISMPHLGASTIEAEQNCAVMAAEQLREFLALGNITNSVNFPSTALPPSTGHRITLCNHNVPGVLSNVLSILADHQINVSDMINKSRDNIAYNILDTECIVEQDVLDAIVELDAVMKVRYLDASYE
uniref:phosphoglycerate dehydrogenase n=1 Tax=Thaumasiovibrio occultus TaxID=1891184 RepID=UPI000B36378D|nr:phosphoglycerate dehydrogenase [Thaumasiovibrio occultus]